MWGGGAEPAPAGGAETPPPGANRHPRRGGTATNPIHPPAKRMYSDQSHH